MYTSLYSAAAAAAHTVASHRSKRRSFFWLTYLPQPIVIHLLTFDFVLGKEKRTVFPFVYVTFTFFWVNAK